MFICGLPIRSASKDCTIFKTTKIAIPAIAGSIAFYLVSFTLFQSALVGQGVSNEILMSKFEDHGMKTTDIMALYALFTPAFTSGVAWTFISFARSSRVLSELNVKFYSLHKIFLSKGIIFVIYHCDKTQK